MRALKILGQRDAAIRARARRATAEALEDAGLSALVGAARRAEQMMEEEGERARLGAPAMAPACAAGCSFCCHVNAYATAPEVLAIADHLRKTLPDEGLAKLRDKLVEHVSRVSPLDDEARWTAKIPCFLLDGAGRCSIYEVRPLRCRAFHSRDAGECKAGFEGQNDASPVLAPLLDRAMNAVEAGYDLALVDEGLSALGLRLEIALLSALFDPSAGARFLAGEPFCDEKGRSS